MTTTVRLNLVASYKKETILNLDLLNKVQPMLPKIAQLLFSENGLDKPTQNLFNNISYYLISFINSQVHASLTWPLFDTKAERTYRNELSTFIADYATKGLLTPVMSSYLVNPACFKVTVLLYQLSQLAVKQSLIPKIKDGNKRKLYDDITDKHNNLDAKSFIEVLDSLHYEENVLFKLSNYLCRRQCQERIAELFRLKIIENENKMLTLNSQGYIYRLVDDFVAKNELDDLSKDAILKIKNINEPATIFDEWLKEVDNELDAIEEKWNNKAVLFVKKCEKMQRLTEETIKRHTGQIERSSYTVEYDPKTDMICTKDLEDQVNSEQKFILRNLQRGGKLNFPNLIRAFLISICCILKNNEIGDEIYYFNEHLENCKRNYNQAVSTLKELIQRASNADKKLQLTPVAICVQSDSSEDYFDIPPLPDLSELKLNRDQNHVIFDGLTPLNLHKHQFNLRRTSLAFPKQHPRFILTPFYRPPKDDLLKSLISHRVYSYDPVNISQSSHNLSVISNIKANETIAECSSGLTKQQITRLLSTKKSTSSKKFKRKIERPDIKIKEGGLFNESFVSNESNLVRSYSSPNLMENRERRILSNIRSRRLSIMKENSPQFEVSGIARLDSNDNTPTGSTNAESSRTNMPTKDDKNRVNNVEADFVKELENVVSPIVPTISITMTTDQNDHSSKTETPKANTGLIAKTSSLEKLIKRFRKINERAALDKHEDIRTIVEEKEIVRTEVVSVNKNLLPDLLSPSFSGLNIMHNLNYLDPMSFEMDEVEPRKSRESLGALLGVNDTFLDQFDLID